jgi:hypothetical protein
MRIYTVTEFTFVNNSYSSNAGISIEECVHVVSARFMAQYGDLKHVWFSSYGNENVGDSIIEDGEEGVQSGLYKDVVNNKYYKCVRHVFK